jgi:hypothetical protein
VDDPAQLRDADQAPGETPLDHRKVQIAARVEQRTGLHDAEAGDVCRRVRMLDPQVAAVG